MLHFAIIVKTCESKGFEYSCYCDLDIKHELMHHVNENA